MPRTRSIETLESLCISTFCKWFHNVAYQYFVCLKKHLVADLNNGYKNRIDLYITEKTEKFFTNFKEAYSNALPPLFHDKILSRFISLLAAHFAQFSKNDIFPGEKGEIKIIYLKELNFCMNLITKCLVTPRTTFLDLSSLTHIAKKWLIYGYSFDTQQLTEFFYELFSHTLVNTNCLNLIKTLKLPHFVDASLINHISFNCPDIEHLILRCTFDCGEIDNTDDFYLSVQYLFGTCNNKCDLLSTENGKESLIKSSGCKYLKTLYLPEGCEKLDCFDNISLILHHMNNLEFLVGLPMLDILNDENKIHSNKSPLKNFHHGAYPCLKWVDFVHYDYEEEIEDYSNVPLEAFTNVEEISVYGTPIQVQIALKYFSSVKKVMLFSDDFALHSIYLKGLTSLDINVGYQEEWPILVALSKSCPELEEFTLRSFTLKLEESMSPVNFPKLLHLKLVEQEEVESNAFSLLTSTCPLLTSIMLWFKLGTEPSSALLLDDEDIQIFVRAHPCIEKFIYRLDNFFCLNINESSSVTYDSVTHLIQFCPNLKCIGNLDYFSLNDEEKQNIVNQIKINNWDLELR